MEEGEELVSYSHSSPNPEDRSSKSDLAASARISFPSAAFTGTTPELDAADDVKLPPTPPAATSPFFRFFFEDASETDGIVVVVTMVAPGGAVKPAIDDAEDDAGGDV